MRIAFLGLLFFLLQSCVAKNGVFVLDRADNLLDRPEWATFSPSTWQEEDQVFFLGYVTVKGESNISAALNMSDEKAVSEPLLSLVGTFLSQSQVGEDLHHSTGNRIISSTSGFRPPMKGLRIVKRYWERVSMEIDGLRRSELRVYSLAAMPRLEYAQALEAYVSHLRGDTEVKDILKKIGERQRRSVSH